MSTGDYFRSRTIYTPLRLTPEERAKLRVLEGTLTVSEYTDTVDVMSWRINRVQLIQQQLADVFAILSGLTVASASKDGARLTHDKSFEDNASFFSSVFEIGRRYKIMNPSYMRSTYGKLMHLLQDAQQREIRSVIGFGCVIPIATVHQELELLDATEILDDPDLPAAAAPILPGDEPNRKRDAVELLLQRYGKGDSERRDRLERCLQSIADDEAITEAHVLPAQRMLELLHAHFDRAAAGKHSLAITAGRQGARLTHTHSTQFAYCEQSLLLWREILSHLSCMWSLAEADLLDGSDYRLRDTGQGLHRVQPAPRVSRFMNQMLSKLQSQVRGGWQGSSAVHLGDNDVPNALHWIDKYTQIPRILGPVVDTIDGLDKLVATAAGVEAYVVATFGSLTNCKKIILADFFKHGFDGSGADNFYDAGSCIDGRLTSAWNWCSNLSKKPYYSLFKMSGFAGFDGDFHK